MAERVGYQQGCGLARALDGIGERWALLVVRELAFGPKRFTDLRADLPGIMPSVLTQRLAELESRGIVERGALAPSSRVAAYGLTARGRDLWPALVALARWGRAGDVPNDADVSAIGAVLDLWAGFDPARAAGVKARIELRLGAAVFALTLRDGVLDIAAGAHPSAKAVLSCAPALFVAVLRRRRSLDEARTRGLEISGKADAVARLVEVCRPVS